MTMAHDSTTTASADSASSQAGKYLTFGLASEEYGIPVLKVREIIKVMDITAVPQVPSHVRGVINLRGKVIPVIDLRLKFGLPSQADTEHTCIIVVQVDTAHTPLMMGVLVDRVSEVLNIVMGEVETPPSFGEGVRTDYMRGVAKVKGTVKILLDIDRVLNVEELEALPQ
jgi:purine-binding chemotaxis protein CheW